ncbi:MAG: hypothetical protein ACOVMN_12035 [Flexibacteraceae bacterium]
MRLSLTILMVILCLYTNAQNPDSIKKERYLEVGTGFLTLGDFFWDYYGNSPILYPTYRGFFNLNQKSKAKAQPIQITYKQQLLNKKWFWYTSFGLDLARKRNNYGGYNYTTIQTVYTNVGGIEKQYLKYNNFCMSLKLGIGFSFFYQEEFSNEPGFGTGMFYDENPPRNIFLIPAIEFQPFNMRFGRKNAAYLNLLSVGTTGLMQLGYSRKW